MNNPDENNSLGSIAIIGMTGRFPGARNVDEFWDNLKNGVESVRFFTREQLKEMGLDDYLLDNPKFVAADAILEDMDMFDASFFDYSAREAEIMDPQHRMFLECAWEAFEMAGYDPESYDGRIAVYAGSALSGYMIRNLYSNPGLVEKVGTFKIMIANSQDFLSTRISYKLNLKGPSVNVNTLCSSSMVAVHLACQNLLNYNCDLALAGGVSFQISRNEAFFYQEGGIGSSDGHCRAFDAKANGTVSGSGLGIVVLKRLEDALRNGDIIYAVIKGTAVNNDGASKNSFTAPNVDGQAECIAEAIAVSGVHPETISYIEAHGTGTNLGDPIEIAALTKAFRAYTDKIGYCAVGSVKTNIGHLVSAGGIASLIKTVLAMQHHLLPPSLNYEIPNPQIDFENSPFYVQTALSRWEGNGAPLRAGVSSFGIGGTNAHVILEEAPPAAPSSKSNRSCHLLVLSAKTQTALDRMTLNLVEYCNNHPDLNLADLVFTLQVGRRSFNYRRMLVCRDLPDLIGKLASLKPSEVRTNCYKPKEAEVVLVFSGTGPAYANIGQELSQTEPVFRTEVDRCCDILKQQLNLDLRRIIHSETSQPEITNQQLSQTGIQRSLAFIINYAMAKLWLEWGVEPQLMMGREIGEYVAACLAGVFSLEDALRMVTADNEAVLRRTINSMVFQKPKIPFISTSTGTRITGEEAVSPEYWLRQPLATRFKEGLQEICQDPDRILISIGPDQELETLIQKMVPEAATLPIITTMRQKVENRSAQEVLLAGIGEFWVAGGMVNWFKLYTGEKRRRIPLPTYPFERKRYWIEPQKRQAPTELEITADSDIASLANDPDFSIEKLTFFMDLSTAATELDSQQQKEQLELALRFRTELAEFCRQFSDATGLRVSLPVGVKVKTLKTLAAAATYDEPEPIPKKPRPDLGNPYIAPRNELEHRIAICWQNVLGFERIGIDDDFFELGGHSLLAAAVANELSRIFQIQIPLRNLFETSTIAETAELIETYLWTGSDEPAIKNADNDEEGML